MTSDMKLLFDTAYGSRAKGMNSRMEPDSQANQDMFQS